jgi:hypothetical protein
MNIILGFVFYTILSQFSGDIIIQLDNHLREKKTNRFTFLEQFLLSLILGFGINSLLTMIIIYFIPFSMLLLLFINILLFVILIVFKISPKNMFWFRLFNFNKNESNKLENKIYYIKYIFFIAISIIIIVNIIEKIQLNNQKPLLDIFVYLHHSLDGIQYGWNLYDPNYLGSYYTFKIYTFYLIPFLSINPSMWYEIIWLYFPYYLLILFFSLNYTLIYRINQNSYLLFLIAFLSFDYLPTWIVYTVPSSWDFYLIFVIIYFLFIDDSVSYIIVPLSIGFLLMFHMVSIIFFGVPLLIGIIIRMATDFRAFPMLNKIKLKFFNFSRMKKLSYILSIVIIILITIILFKPLLQRLFSIYESYYFIYYNSSFYDAIVEEVKNKTRIAIIIFILSILMIRKDGTFKDVYPFVIFSIIFFFILFIAYWNFPEMRYYIRTPYLPYRYKIYYDFGGIYALIITFHFFDKNNLFGKVRIWSNSILKDIIQKIKNDEVLSHKIFPTVKTIFILVVLTVNRLPQVYTNLIEPETPYRYQQFTNYWPGSYIHAMEYVLNISDKPVYAFNPESQIINWNIAHTFMRDSPCINLSEFQYYAKESNYPDMTSDFSYQNWVQFYIYMFVSNKTLYPYSANYKNIPKTEWTTYQVDYIFVDSFTNRNLVIYLLNTPTFEMIFSEEGNWGGIIHTVYVFKVLY